MTIFSITPDNNITAHATEAEAKSITEAEQFSNAKELAKLAAKWPASRLLDIWTLALAVVGCFRNLIDRDLLKPLPLS